MKKMMHWVLAATLICGASVMTSCKEARTQEESDRLATVVHQELAALFPGTTYTDRGHHDFDSFLLGSVPRRPEAGLAPPSRDELRRAGAGRADHRRTGRASPLSRW